MAKARRSRFGGFLLVPVFLVVAGFWASAARAEGRAVVAPETPVRSAPFDVAPEIARLRAGDKVFAVDPPQGLWRRIALPDGRYGFVREADTQQAENVPLPGSAPPAGQSSSAPTQPTKSPGPPAGPQLLGVMFEMFPVGTLTSSASAGAPSSSTDSVFAVGVAPFFDGALSPYFALGLSPQMLFRVKNDGNTIESAKELDVRARLTARLPLSQRVRVFARVSPAYSLILLPSAPPGATTPQRSNPHGFLIGGSTGVEVAVLPNFFVVTDLGYQSGFQNGSDGDMHTSYLHLGAGFAIGL